MKTLFSLVTVLILAALLVVAQGGPADAALRSAPGWWDPDGAGTGSDWHYRVPVTLPAGSSINSTARVDLDFAALQAQLEISGTFDVQSVRVVRPGGTLAAVQEFNRSIYAGATNAVSTRGEVRWIVEDGGAQTYQVYFDIAQNGTKPANPQTPINGGFEQSASGTPLPAGWSTASRSDPIYDLEVRPAETVTVTSNGTPLQNPRQTNGNPRTGNAAFLMGARSHDEPETEQVQSEATVLTRQIAVPATNPGSLSFNWRAEGWDSASFDHLTISIIAPGGAATELVGNGLNAYATWPTSPNLGAGPTDTSKSGYGHYNGFDMTTGGTHTAGMSVAYNAEAWWNRSYPLAAFAGQTVTLRITTTHVKTFRSWFHIDDVEWSVVAGVPGDAEAFGVQITSPIGNLAPGQTVRVVARVDAQPGGAGNPVLGDVLAPDGTVYFSNIVLYNDGAHGDGAAGDAVWASVNQTIPLDALNSTGWLVRVRACDASTSTSGTASNGLIHRSSKGTALIAANWWNIDEATFAVQGAVIDIAKTMTVLVDGVNASGFKALPGARLRYCITITNGGPAQATTIEGTDQLPAATSYAPGSLRSGPTCASAATAEDDDETGVDEIDPIGAGISGGQVTVHRPALDPSGSFAVTYEVLLH